MPWFFAVAERDHALQNPTRPAKVRRVGEHIRLGPQSHILDVACGRAGPASILAEAFGCRVLGVEKSPDFVEAARERITQANLGDLIEVVESDARDFPIESDRFDAVMCLGASFIWDGLDGTLASLTPAVRPGGYVVVGEAFWRRWPLPSGVDHMGFTTLSGTTERFVSAGLVVIGVVVSSEDDWDAYESLHWRALEEWLAANPTDPDAGEIRRQHEESRNHYLRIQRELLGWGIVIGWKRR
jgi:SAM-dependent methyltransferase